MAVVATKDGSGGSDGHMNIWFFISIDNKFAMLSHIAIISHTLTKQKKKKNTKQRKEKKRKTIP